MAAGAEVYGASLTYYQAVKGAARVRVPGAEPIKASVSKPDGFDFEASHGNVPRLSSDFAAPRGNVPSRKPSGSMLRGARFLPQAAMSKLCGARLLLRASISKVRGATRLGKAAVSRLAGERSPLAGPSRQVRAGKGGARGCNAG